MEINKYLRIKLYKIYKIFNQMIFKILKYNNKQNHL
jgi:hypothetical protein